MRRDEDPVRANRGLPRAAPPAFRVSPRFVRRIVGGEKIGDARSVDRELLVHIKYRRNPEICANG